MPFVPYQSLTAARIGQPLSLGRAHIDQATFALSLIYFEHVQDEQGVWHCVQDEEPLTLNDHYSFDGKRGMIQLLDHPLWQQEGSWRAADRQEPLLYKGAVKWPQVILFAYEHYKPEEIVLPQKVKVQGTVRIFREADALRMVDFAEIDQEALTRLGYELPRHVEGSNDNL